MCGRHGVHCNICLGDDFHPSWCTAPVGAGRVSLFGVGAHWTFNVHQRCGGTKIQCGSAVVTCTAQIGRKRCLFRMLGHLVDRGFFSRHSVLDDPEHSALAVLTT